MAWFADATNGIKTFRASERLCVGDTCITETELRARLHCRRDPASPAQPRVEAGAGDPPKIEDAPSIAPASDGEITSPADPTSASADPPPASSDEIGEPGEPPTISEPVREESNEPPTAPQAAGEAEDEAAAQTHDVNETQVASPQHTDPEEPAPAEPEQAEATTEDLPAQ